MNTRSTFTCHMGHIILEARDSSPSEVHAILDLAPHCLILEPARDDANIATIITARCPYAQWSTRCGILLEDFESGVHFAPHPVPYRGWVAFDSIVALVSWNEPRCLMRRKTSIAPEALIVDAHGGLIHVSELGADALDPEGKRRWTIVGDDALTEYTLDGDIFTCEFADGSSQSHSLAY